MSITDPIADYLTIIRNGLKARFKYVDVPASNIKRQLSRLLVDQGFIQKFIVIEDSKQGILRIWLKYNHEGMPAISTIKRVSTPGRRMYVNSKKLPRVRNNLGIAVLTTSKGIMTAREASRNNVGGEVLCYVW
ncbi:30S ribosomal protein S8 [Calditrichota bacterium]